MLRHFLCGLALAACSSAAYAQTSTPLDQERADRALPSSPDVGAPVAPAAAVRIDAMHASTPIQSIQFEGTDVPEVVARAA